MLSATADPPSYTAVQSGKVIRGAVGSIRGADGRDAPFFSAGPLEPGPTLIVAVRYVGNGHYAYGAVRVSVSGGRD